MPHWLRKTGYRARPPPNRDHRIGTAGPRGRHAPESCISARVHRKEESGFLDVLIELLPGDACLRFQMSRYKAEWRQEKFIFLALASPHLDPAVHILLIDLDHSLHPPQVDAQTTVRGCDVALEGRADAKRYHRGVRAPASGNQLGDLGSALGECDLGEIAESLHIHP